MENPSLLLTVSNPYANVPEALRLRNFVRNMPKSTTYSKENIHSFESGQNIIVFSNIAPSRQEGGRSLHKCLSPALFTRVRNETTETGARSRVSVGD